MDNISHGSIEIGFGTLLNRLYNTLMKKPLFVWRTVGSIAVLTSALLFSFSLVNAQFLPVVGGIILTWIPCDSGDVWMIVGLPRPASIMVSEACWNLYPPPLEGEWSLGNYVPIPDVCFLGPYPVGAGFECVHLGSGAVPP